MTITKSYLKDLTYQINGSAIEVHKELGPGLLENVYKECMVHELRLRGINCISEMLVPIHFKGLQLTTQLRCDLFVENIYMVELKAVKTIDPIFEAKLLTYMKLAESPKGSLINFNVMNIYTEGQKTYVNEYFRLLAE